MHKIHKLFVYSYMVLFSFNAFSEPKELLRKSDGYFFHQSFNDLKEELNTAREKGKKGIFIMFSDKDCPWCTKMKETVLSQIPIQDYFRENFQVLIIDIHGDNTMTSFKGREIIEKDFSFKNHRVRATPVFMFFDLTGSPIMRYTGSTRNGREFKWLGEFVVNGIYKEMNFTKYKRERVVRLKK